MGANITQEGKKKKETIMQRMNLYTDLTPFTKLTENGSQT
jgi:hypothetical protein